MGLDPACMVLLTPMVPDVKLPDAVFSRFVSEPWSIAQYSSASMMVSTRAVTVGSAASGECMEKSKS